MSWYLKKPICKRNKCFVKLNKTPTINNVKQELNYIKRIIMLWVKDAFRLDWRHTIRNEKWSDQFLFAKKKKKKWRFTFCSTPLLSNDAKILQLPSWSDLLLLSIAVSFGLLPSIFKHLWNLSITTKYLFKCSDSACFFFFFLITIWDSEKWLCWSVSFYKNQCNSKLLTDCSQLEIIRPREKRKS